MEAFFGYLIAFVIIAFGFIFGSSSGNSESSNDFDAFDDDDYSASTPSEMNEKDKEALETWYWKEHK